MALLTSSFSVFACRCIEQPLETKIANADIVVLGKVVQFLSADVAGNQRSDMATFPQEAKVKEIDRIARQEPIYVVFVIDKAYKLPGKIEIDTIVVATMAQSSMCGFNFELGREYILFAQNTDAPQWMTVKRPIYITNTCTGTQIFSAKVARSVKCTSKKMKRK